MICATRLAERSELLEEILQCKLHDSGIAGSCCYVAEGGAGVRARGIAEDCFVGNIEYLPAELHLLGFSVIDGEVPGQGHIELIVPWPDDAQRPLRTEGTGGRNSEVRVGDEIVLRPEGSAVAKGVGRIDCERAADSRLRGVGSGGNGEEAARRSSKDGCELPAGDQHVRDAVGEVGTVQDKRDVAYLPAIGVAVGVAQPTTIGIHRRRNQVGGTGQLGRLRLAQAMRPRVVGYKVHLLGSALNRDKQDRKSVV